MAKSRSYEVAEETSTAEATATEGGSELLIGGIIILSDSVPFGLYPWQWHIMPPPRPPE